MSDNRRQDERFDQAAPHVIRAACRARFYRSLDILSEIAEDDESRAADRIKAIITLGQFGLGTADQGAVHIHAGEGSQIVGVVQLPVLEPVPEGAEDEEHSEVPAKGDKTDPKLLAAG